MPRLLRTSKKLGLASKARMDRVIEKQELTDLFVKFLVETSIKPEEINPILEENGTAKINQSMKMFKIAARPQLDFSDLQKLEKVREFISMNSIDREVIEQTEIHVKYAGYIEKEKNQADKFNRLENVSIPSKFDYYKVKSISIEAKQKLSKIQPTTISQASRISGVSPSDISVLLVYMGR